MGCGSTATVCFDAVHHVYDRSYDYHSIHTIILRLRKASLCVIGTDAVAGELCKNLVLCGIGKLVLIDPLNSVVIADDLVRNFLCTQKDIGDNVRSDTCYTYHYSGIRTILCVESLCYGE